MRGRSSLIILVPLLVVVLAVYYFFAWIPLQEDIGRARLDMEAAELELEQARAVHARMDDMKAEIEQIQTALEEMEKMILEAPYQPELLVYLQDIEEEHEVQISRIDYGPVQTMDGGGNPELAELHAIDVGLGFFASFQQAVSFVTEVEEGYWFSASGGFDFHESMATVDDEEEEVTEVEGIEGMYTFRIFYWSEIGDPVMHPELPEFPETGRDEPFRP